MAKIPGWVYLIVGVAIAVVSKWVEAKTKPGQFKLFFWLGIAFVVIGVFKLVAKYVFKMGAEEKERMTARRQGPMRANARSQAMQNRPQQPQYRPHHDYSNPHELQHMQGQHHVSEPDQRQGSQDSSIISCPNCSTRHYSYADFCMKCGTRMK